jgi:hypothetical protein
MPQVTRFLAMLVTAAAALAVPVVARAATREYFLAAAMAQPYPTLDIDEVMSES